MATLRMFKMEGTNMQNFTEDQINRQDFVDNAIYDLVKRLIPLPRDTIQHWLVDKYKIIDELEFYP
jgi:hypothetical protein